MPEVVWHNIIQFNTWSLLQTTELYFMFSCLNCLWSGSTRFEIVSQLLGTAGVNCQKHGPWFFMIIFGPRWCVRPVLCGCFTSLFSSHCPPVCMPAAGCKPIRPPGQLLQPLPLLQRHQHRQGSPGGRQLLPLLRDFRSKGGLRFDTLPARGYVPGNCAGSCYYATTCWGAAATAAGYHDSYRWVIG